MAKNTFGDEIQSTVATAPRPGGLTNEFGDPLSDIGGVGRDRLTQRDFLSEFLFSDKKVEEWLPSDQAALAQQLLDSFDDPEEERARIQNTLLLSELLEIPESDIQGLQPEVLKSMFGEELTSKAGLVKIKNGYAELDPFTAFKSAASSAVEKPALALRGLTAFTPGQAFGFDNLAEISSDYLLSLVDETKRQQVAASLQGMLWPSEGETPWYRIEPRRIPEAVNTWAAVIGDYIPLMVMTRTGQVLGKAAGAPVGTAVATGVGLLTGGPDPTDVAVVPAVAAITQQVLTHVGGAAPLRAIEAGGFLTRAEQLGIDKDIAEEYARIFGPSSGAIEYAQNLWNLGVFKRLPKEARKTALKGIIRELGGAAVEGFEEVTQGGLENFLINKAIDAQRLRDPEFVAEKTPIFEDADRKFAIGAGLSLVTRAGGRAAMQAISLKDRIGVPPAEVPGEPVATAPIAEPAEAEAVATEAEPVSEEVEEVRAPAEPTERPVEAEITAPRAEPVISNPEVAKLVDDAKPDILADVETGSPVSVDVVRGFGRATKEEVFSSGEGESAFGPGRYSAIDETFAEHFGPNIERLTVQLDNPFVLTNDEQLADLVGRPIPRDGKPRQQFLREARAAIEELGHDGMIINIPNFGDIDTTGKSAKRLIEISGATQTVEFDKPTAAEAPVATLPGTEIEFDQIKAPITGGGGENIIQFLKDGKVVKQNRFKTSKAQQQFARDMRTLLTEAEGIEPTAQGGLVEPIATSMVEKLVKSRVISEKAFDNAVARLTDPGKLRAGLSFEDIKDLTTIGAFHFESGVRNLAEWSGKMIETLGEFIRPHLRDIYRRVVQQEVREGKENQIDAEVFEEFEDEKWAARALVRKEKGIKPAPARKGRRPSKKERDAAEEAELPAGRPTRAEQAVIDAKKFNADIAAQKAQTAGEAGVITIETEEVDDITEPFGKTMSPEWYEANSEVYRKTILEKGTDLAKTVVRGFDFLGGATRTRLSNISPELGRRLARHEFNVLTRTTEHTKRIEPFLKATKKRKLGKVDFVQFDLAYKNSDAAKMSELAEKHGFTKELAEFRKVNDELFNMGNAVGLGIDYLKNHFHRSVKDTKGFLEHFQGRDDWSIVRTAIENKEEARGRALTEVERAAMVNTLLRGYRTSALSLSAPGAAKERTVQEVTAEINQFYHSPINSARNYVETMNEKIAAREFFGRQSAEITKLRARESTLLTRLAKLGTRKSKQKATDIDREIRLGFFTGTLTEHISHATEELGEVVKKLERIGADDLQNTVGQYVLELVIGEEIKPSQEKDVRDLLMGRFDPQSTHGLVGEIIPLTYIDVLTQITSAITQLEEHAIAFYNSPVGFIPAATKAILNISEITLQDIGVTTIGQELTDVDSRRILSTLLSITGFKKFDALGKQALINTELSKLRSQAKKEGRAFSERLEKVFGAETGQVVEDLKAGLITEDVKFLVFSRLLDVQPIALSEMPEAYNRAGNLKIFYQLRTFTLKQLDFVRTEALQDMRDPKGDPTRFMRGFGKLMWLSFSLAMFGAARDRLVDFITGRPFDLSDSVIDTFLRRVFFSRFQYSKAMGEGFGRAFLEGFIPATKTVDAITRDIVRVSKGDEDGLDVWRSVPIVGDLYYFWFGRGLEKAAKEQKRAKREKTRRKPLSTKRGKLKSRRKKLKRR